jgi:hypothetical protein
MNAGIQMALPGNPRRISLSIVLTTATLVQVTADTGDFPAIPNNSVQQSQAALLFGNNTPSALRYDYKFYGGLIQRPIWLRSFVPAATVEFSEVCINCPFSDQFESEIFTGVTFSRYSRANITFPSTSIQVMPGNENRVCFAVRRQSGGHTDIRLGGASQSNTIMRHNSPTQFIPITYGMVGDPVAYPVTIDVGNSGGGTFDCIEILKA